MKHLQEEWFKRSLEAHNKGHGQIFAFNSLALRYRFRKFYDEGKDKIKAYDRYFEPNPFTRQYDLLVYCWINFRQILNEEIGHLRAKAIKEKNETFNSLADQIVETNTLYGVTRSDFMYGACELRWPSALMNGAYRGPLVRDPWMEERTEAFSDEKYKFIMTFGGGGQGKTLTFIALNLVLWDHYIFTEKGARCLISTVSKDKLESAAWSYLQQLLHSTEKDISLYAGKGIISGDYTIKRPDNRDVAGVYKGVLLANRLEDTAVTDKLTGSHGHPYFGYVMDEAQSTSPAPIKASSNYTMHAGDFRVMGAGNYSEDTDTLGQNVKPSTGWDSVTEETGKWMSYLINHQPAIVLHFSNDRSPGMTEEGAKKFPYLPNQKKLDQLYPTIASRSLHNNSYRRFWLGWRVENEGGEAVITKQLTQDTGCNKPLRLSSVLCTFLAFDSAQGEGDRNMLVEFKDGIDAETKQRVWGPVRGSSKFQASESIEYYTECTKWIAETAKLRGVKSGDIVLDWTGRPAHREMLSKINLQSMPVIFHQGVPNGVRKDVITKRIEKAILVNPDPEHKLYAHQIAYNYISLGAWLLQQYVAAGRVRGLNQELLDAIGENHGIDEELFARTFEKKVSQVHGELFNLPKKKEFKNQYGFSPEYFDVLCMAALFMFLKRHLPINPITSDGQELSENKDLSEELEEHQGLWNDDLLPY